MPRYHCPGHPAFLDAAASEIGRAEAALAARRDATLAAVANLCAQAAEVDARHVAGILAEAEALADRLRVSLLAADMMLAHVRSGRDGRVGRHPISPDASEPSRGRLALKGGDMPDPIYATDEDIALRATADFAILCPRDQKLAAGSDGSFDPSDRWTLQSASVDFSAQGVLPGQVVQLLGPASAFRAAG